MSEADLGLALSLAFPYRFPRLLIERRNILNVETRDGWRARSGKKGQADYFVSGRGVHIEIETKAAKHKWYAQQVAWRKRCGDLGIPYLVARALPGEDPDVTVARWLDEIEAMVSPC